MSSVVRYGSNLRNGLQPVKVLDISQNLGFLVRFGAEICIIMVGCVGDEK